MVPTAQRCKIVRFTCRFHLAASLSRFVYVNGGGGVSQHVPAESKCLKLLRTECTWQLTAAVVTNQQKI